MFPLRLFVQYCTTVICLSLVVAASDAVAVDLHPGDIIVSATDFNVQPYQEVLIRVDPTSGAIDVIASPTVGSGPALSGNERLALDANGQILAGRATDSGGGILRINPVTGERSILSDASHGNGPVPDHVLYLDNLADGSILAYNPTLELSKALFRVDATTGDRSVVAVAPIGYPGITVASGLSVAANGEVLIGSNFPGQLVVRLDLDTGENSVVSSTSTNPWIPGVGSGSDLTFPGILGQTFDLSGQFFYALQVSNLLRIDPATGNRELISSWDPANPKGSGPALWQNAGLGVSPNGDLVTWDVGNKLYRINPTTGDRSLIVDLEGYSIGDFAVVPQPVPEPTTLGLAGIGIFAAVMMRRRFGVRICSRPR